MDVAGKVDLIGKASLLSETKDLAGEDSTGDFLADDVVGRVDDGSGFVELNEARGADENLAKPEADEKEEILPLNEEDVSGVFDFKAATSNGSGRVKIDSD